MNKPDKPEHGEERISLHGHDPEDLPPEHERCPLCGGHGYLWQAPAQTEPPQEPAWRSCRACDRTGIEPRTKNTPHRPKPIQPPGATRQ
jgi:hypothetical protein